MTFILLPIFQSTSAFHGRGLASGSSYRKNNKMSYRCEKSIPGNNRLANNIQEGIEIYNILLFQTTFDSPIKKKLFDRHLQMQIKKPLRNLITTAHMITSIAQNYSTTSACRSLIESVNLAKNMPLKFLCYKISPKPV